MITLIIIAFIFEKKTVFARRIYLIGANPEAARLSGINVAKYLTALYILSGLLAGITGILLASEFKAGVSNRATGWSSPSSAVSVLRADSVRYWGCSSVPSYSLL
jgi:ribose/xylose/arabinose/galactoside ABC-type transport system permease subunit